MHQKKGKAGQQLGQHKDSQSYFTEWWEQWGVATLSFLPDFEIPALLKHLIAYLCRECLLPFSAISLPEPYIKIQVVQFLITHLHGIQASG